jgi:excisionase family DNA binding protein
MTAEHLNPVLENTPMTNGLESVIREFLKSVLLDVAHEVLSSNLSGGTALSSIEMPTEHILLRSSEAAKLLGISERHLFAITRSGVLPCVHVGRLVRYSRDTIREWIRQAESTVDLGQVSKPARQQLKPAKEELRHVEHPKKRIQKKSTHAVNTSHRRSTARATSVVPQSQRDSNQGTENGPRSVVAFFANKLGISQDALPCITNGELMTIAEVDIPTLHGWQYLNRDLPESAMAKLQNYFATYLGCQQNNRRK